MGRKAVVAVGLAALLSLVGCSAPSSPDIPRFATSGGQTQAELEARLAGIPGLVFTDASGSEPNLKRATGYAFTVQVAPGYEIADAPALVDFLVRSAWSVRDGYMPNTTIAITVNAGALPSDKIDIVEAAEVAGWVPEGSQSHRFGADGGSSPEFDNGTSSVDIWLDIDTLSEKRAAQRGSTANRERLGDWPGDAAEPPTGMVVPTTTP
jgi:hypothetical protein